MVYQLDTPGLEDQAVTTSKIDTGAVTLERAAASVTNALVPGVYVMVVMALQT